MKLSVGYKLQHKRVLFDTVVPTIFARSGTLHEANHNTSDKSTPTAPPHSTPVRLLLSVTDIDGSTYASGADRNHQSS